jgi:oligoribonuclease NrnB/cAMP/cGMP phosphodiesterase (DHH superfamily)
MFEKAKKYLPKGAQVLQLTHAYCADGTGCSVVLNNCPINVTTRPVKFDLIDNVMQEIDYDAYDAVLITDIAPSDGKLLDLSDNIILIDHHQTSMEFNDHSKNRYITEDYCGTVYVAEFCEEIFNVDLSHLYDFLELTNDYDMWIKDNPKSTEMNMLYYNMWHHNYLNRFIDGNVNFTAEERRFIANQKLKIDLTFDALDIMEVGLDDGCFIITRQFVNEMCDKLMAIEDYKLVFSYNDKNGNCSVRNSYENVNIGEVIKSLGYGGGHAGAGGMTEKDTTKLPEKIKKVCEAVKKIINED